MHRTNLSPKALQQHLLADAVFEDRRADYAAAARAGDLDAMDAAYDGAQLAARWKSQVLLSDNDAPTAQAWRKRW